MDIFKLAQELSVLPLQVLTEYATDFLALELALKFKKGGIVKKSTDDLFGGVGERVKLYDTLLDLSGLEDQDINKELIRKKYNQIKPLKSKYMVFENGFMWQVDIKHFPEGQDRKPFILVCVDVSTRLCDAEPLSNLQEQNVRQAMVTILRRHIIQEGLPKIIVTDGGPEFGNAFTAFLNHNGIKHRKTASGRKQQTAIVEHTNELIGYALMAYAYKRRTEMRQPTQNPLNYKAINIFGNGILERIVETINNWARSKFPLDVKEWHKLNMNIPATDLREGDLVLIPNLQDARIRHRSGQHNYKREPFRITRVFRPVLEKQPYRFETNYRPNLTFGRDELIKVDDYNHINPIIEFSQDALHNGRLRFE